MARRVAFTTFGCKLNQCETAGIRAQFTEPGYTVVSFDEPADVVIINTCSVTGRADAQARQLIRRVVRDRPDTKLVVTGCYAQRAPHAVAAIPGVTLVAGNGEKDRLRGIVDDLGWWQAGGRAVGAAEGASNSEPGTPPEPAGPVVAVADLRKTQRSFDLSPVEFGERTRAYVRVQDGCDAACSFCIIPHIRGRSTSLDRGAAVGRVARLVEEGFREVILTGIHLGLYGRDRVAAGSLADVIDEIEKLPGDFRVRLSSIEPQEIDDRIIARMAAGGRLVPHLHVPLQSGSDRILGLMNRTYSAGEYRSIVERLTRRVDPFCLGADVIVGFPGETDADFRETVRFIEDQPFTYLHVFPYSPRPGTRAASLPGRPPGDVTDERSRVLRDLSETRRRAFAERFVERRMRILVEEPVGEQGWQGLSDEYVRVAFPWLTGEDLTGAFVDVTGLHREEGMLAGAPVEGG